MPPFIVYKSFGRLYDSWMKGGPENAVYTTSNSDWMEKEQFIQWLESVFIPETKRIQGTNHILLLDGHGSHVTLKAIEVCSQNSITLICLPANSSHILQPLDVGVYCHVKKAWKKIVQEYYSSTGYKILDKENFAPLLKKLYAGGDAFTRIHAVSGFHKTGFFPLDVNNVDKNKLKIAQTFNLLEDTSSSPTIQLESSTNSIASSSFISTSSLAPLFTTVSNHSPLESTPINVSY